MNSGSLTKKYLKLKELGDAADSAELDRIYREIVNLPIITMGDAVEKLQFARQCLTDEHDLKEAQSLIRQVCDALERPSYKVEMVRRWRRPRE